MRGLDKVDLVLLMPGERGLQVREAAKLVAVERCCYGDEAKATVVVH